MQYIQSQPVCLKKLTPAARREHTKNRIGFVHFTLNQYNSLSGFVLPELQKSFLFQNWPTKQK